MNKQIDIILSKLESREDNWLGDDGNEELFILFNKKRFRAKSSS